MARPCASHRFALSDTVAKTQLDRLLRSLVVPRTHHAAVRQRCSRTLSSAKQTSAKTYDVIALGNLCVDIVTPTMDKLPPVEVIKSRELLQQLTEQADDQSLWEVGANCNFLIASARLGLRAACIGNLGDDIYGRYLLDNLQAEGIVRVEPLAPNLFSESLKHTLLCFVLVDSTASHAFCSRYDFGPWPLLPGVHSLTPAALQMLQDTRALLINGFLFDELPPEVVLHAASTARSAGCAVFFDPGPRAWTLPAAVLHGMLDVADVVVTTQEEAQVMTGEADPQAAGRQLLSRPGAATRWCFVKLGPSGAILCSKDLSTNHWQPAMQVTVADTVGCGDSFAAACVLGYISQAAPQQLLTLANAVGAATATGIGAGRNVATAEAVLQLLASAEMKPAASGSTNSVQQPSTQDGRGMLSHGAVIDDDASRGLSDEASLRHSSVAVASEQEALQTRENGHAVNAEQDVAEADWQSSYLHSEQTQAVRQGAAKLLLSSIARHKQ